MPECNHILVIYLLQGAVVYICVPPKRPGLKWNSDCLPTLSLKITFTNKEESEVYGSWKPFNFLMNSSNGVNTFISHLGQSQKKVSLPVWH